MKRIAVIGAGPSGMACLRSFRSALEKEPSLESELDIVCFERQENWGGIWNFTLETGQDEYGEPIHSSMYKYLFSNAPKECLEFGDYTFEEHFGHPIASYPPREVLWHYIQGRVEKAGVRQWCRFRTPIRHITYDSSAQVFEVTSHDLIEDLTQTESFDYVIVASGHFSTPNVPDFDGLDINFKGEVLHSHDFRDAALYKGQDLLVIGASYSAEDIALQSWKYGAKSITISYRSRPLGLGWPSNIDERPLLQSVDREGVFHFKDGSTKKFDTVVLCTGYLHDFPFLPEDLKLVTDNRLWPSDLYKGVVFEPNPRLFFMGMQNQFYTFKKFDAQACFVRDVILGRISLPPPPDMKSDSQKWREREEALQTISEMIWFQGDYVKELMQHTDCPTFDVDASNRYLEAWVRDKNENILTYRDKAYPSLATGAMSPIPRTKWVNAKHDMHFLTYFKPKVQAGPATGGTDERKKVLSDGKGNQVAPPENAGQQVAPGERADQQAAPAEKAGCALQVDGDSARGSRRRWRLGGRLFKRGVAA